MIIFYEKLDIYLMKQMRDNLEVSMLCDSFNKIIT